MTCKHCFHWDRASETFNTEIQTCCECGYIDTSISRIDKLTQQAVELGFYQQTKDQEAISRVRALAEYIGSSPDIESQNIALAIEKALDGEG